MKILLTMALMTLGFSLGLIAPDVDQKTSLIVHRSILTHGPWFALMAILLSTKSNSRHTMPLIGAAFAAGLCWHLAADLFPRSWTGFALIHIPAYGSLPGTASVCWILASLIISVFAVLLLGWRSLPREE